MPMSGLNHRSEQSVRDSDRSALDRDEIPRRDIVKGFIEVEPVIVGKFAFQHDMTVNPISESGTQSDVVGCGLRDAEPIEKYSSFHSRLTKGECCE